jgi:imidazolonepropionase-like amidohydrolase
MKITAQLVLGFIGLLTACNNKQSPDRILSGDALLIYNARLIDVEHGGILQKDAVLLDSGRIIAIDNHSKLNDRLAEARQIDVRGKYVMPGLWDMHVHIEGENLIEDNRLLFPVYLAYGITTVRDCASDLGELVLAWRDSIAANQLLGPQIFTAGRKLEGINSIWKGDLEIGNERELQQSLDTLETLKVDFVKITENTLQGPLFLRSVQEAHKRGYKVSGHVPYELTIRELLNAGFSSVEHATYMLRLGSDEEMIIDKLDSGTMNRAEAGDWYLAHFNQDTAAAAYRELGKAGLAVTPTLIGGRQLAYLDETDHSRDEFLQYLTDRFISNYQWRIDRMAGEGSEQKQIRKDRYHLVASQLPYLQQAGITLLAGSDAAALNTYVYPALALHEELGLFREAGLEPLEILRAATINGARFMGRDASMGSIAIGKQADLLILNDNPLEDIRSTTDIYALIKDGTYLDRTALDGFLEAAKTQKQVLNRQRSMVSE